MLRRVWQRAFVLQHLAKIAAVKSTRRRPGTGCNARLRPSAARRSASRNKCLFGFERLYPNAQCGGIRGRSRATKRAFSHTLMLFRPFLGGFNRGVVIGALDNRARTQIWPTIFVDRGHAPPCFGGSATSLSATNAVGRARPVIRRSCALGTRIANQKPLLGGEPYQRPCIGTGGMGVLPMPTAEYFRRASRHLH
jgi:hypothetical protein